MQDVPKIVLTRLPKTAAEEAHPDADLLTAFTEQSLGKSERARVMEHLARCGDCRDVVAFALPAGEAATLPSSVTAAGRGWVSWPVLRWGVVAAGVLIVTSVGVLQYRHRQENSSVLVSKLMPRERTALTAAQSPSSPRASEPQAFVPQIETAKQKESRKSAPSQTLSAMLADNPSPSTNAILPPPPSRARSAGALAGSSGGVSRDIGSGSGGGQAAKAPLREYSLFDPAARNAMTVATPKQTPAQGADSQVAVGSSSQTVEVQADAAGVAQNQVLAQVENHYDRPVQGRPADSDVVKAKDLAAVQAPAEPSAPLPPAAPTAQRASPRWAIGSSGSLQRSFDAGQTWEDVKVIQAAVGGNAQLGSTVEYKVLSKQKKTMKQEKAQPAAILVFRAVAAIDPEVWAGGSGGMLYHSVDSGAHWTQVLPSEAGVVLTGDVVGVEFSNPQYGRIATSAGEVWTTTDAGQTWHKQQ